MLNSFYPSIQLLRNHSGRADRNKCFMLLLPHPADRNKNLVQLSLPPPVILTQPSHKAAASKVFSVACPPQFEERRRKGRKKNPSLQPGFTLLELVIGLMISTILITMSFAIYNQIARATQTIQKITSNDTRAMILKDRLQKDFLGISLLWFTPKKYEAMTKAPALQNTKEEKEAEQEKKSTSDEKKKKEKSQQDDDFFYAENNQEGMAVLFSFITTSALQMYGAESKRFVRLVYSLKKSPSAEGRFTLFRKEMDATEFNADAANGSGIFYEIASNIKGCFLEYGFIDPMVSSNKEDKDKPAETSWLKEWSGKQEKTKPLIPKFIKMKIIFLQEKGEHEQEYEFCFITPQDAMHPYTSFTQQNYHKELQAKSQPQQPAATPPTPDPAQTLTASTSSTSPIPASATITLPAPNVNPGGQHAQ